MANNSNKSLNTDSTMKTTFALFLLLIITGCNLQSSEFVLTPNYERACKRRCIADFNELMESDSLQILDFKRLLTAKTMDQSGQLTEIDLEEGMQILCKMKDQTSLVFPLPIFEINGTDHAVLFSNGKGLWGPIWMLILVDRKTAVIQNVVCDHKGEAPVGEVSFKDSIYSNRYRDFEFKASEFKSKNIDGVTGATTTHDAYVKTIKNAVEKYEKY